jgi:hypothetical protein
VKRVKILITIILKPGKIPTRNIHGGRKKCEGGIKTHVMGELKKYAVYALSYLDKALELHFKNPFRKWRFKKYIYK